MEEMSDRGSSVEERSDRGSCECRSNFELGGVSRGQLVVSKFRDSLRRR